MIVTGIEVTPIIAAVARLSRRSTQLMSGVSSRSTTPRASDAR
jgi:hypothetical protein